VFSRYRALIVTLSIALQGVEVLVASVGHHHEGESAAHFCQARGLAEDPCEHDRYKCGHDQHQAAEPDCAGQQSAPEHLPAAPHDDCAVCRHFSQPVAPVAVIPEVTGSELVAAFVPTAVCPVILVTKTSQQARGPPRSV
jgi:hypothetical protein